MRASSVENSDLTPLTEIITGEATVVATGAEMVATVGMVATGAEMVAMAAVHMVVVVATVVVATVAVAATVVDEVAEGG